MRGVVVTNVEKGSPAEKAGLTSPDVILGVNGKRVDSTSELQGFLINSDLRVGDRLKLTIFRDAKEEEVIVKLEKRK
jgi:serine protease Do